MIEKRRSSETIKGQKHQQSAAEDDLETAQSYLRNTKDALRAVEESLLENALACRQFKREPAKLLLAALWH